MTKDHANVHTITFYSFKGGVGRTSSLVNVAAELSRAGRRVLLVDFDLEAPGLSTFDALRPSKPHPGVVEFISHYLATSAAPDVRGYCYKASGEGALARASGAGELWVMPAGKGDSTYGAQLSIINWQTLYAQRNGYLLFEDLREQWQQAIRPDYVLIDSRTGHTDITGICTRHLPDSVVVLFYPDEQNLAGLVQVVNDIRCENNRASRRKIITMHFAMSNVPDLDDEDHILQIRAAEFKRRLAYENLDAVIHHYPSLALVNQAIFTQSRPNSRLAHEYRALRDAIVRDNLEDRDGALSAIDDALSEPYWAGYRSHGSMEERLRTVLTLHSKDPAVLFGLATVHKRSGRLQEALHLLDRAIELRGDRSEYLLERADARALLGDPRGASVDVRAVLQLPHLDGSQVERAIRVLKKSDPSLLGQLVKVEPIVHLGSWDLISIAAELKGTRDELRVARDLLDVVAGRPTDDTNLRCHLQNERIVVLIGLADFVGAIRVLGARPPDLESLDINTAFNYGMAKWGLTGESPCDLFGRVIELDALSSDTGGDVHRAANYNQCMALALAVIGRDADASRRLENAIQIIKERPEAEFSCWRYLDVEPKAFSADCGEIAEFIRRGRPTPPVFQRPLFGDRS